MVYAYAALKKAYRLPTAHRTSRRRSRINQLAVDNGAIAQGFQDRPDPDETILAPA